jgi:zinc/manganese transport system permease protein
VGFYLVFACAVTISVQLIGVYLVFASLIVPPLATRKVAHHRMASALALGVAGSAAGLALSVAFDWPTGPVIVWSLAIIGAGVWVRAGRELPASHAIPKA